MYTPMRAPTVMVTAMGIEQGQKRSEWDTQGILDVREIQVVRAAVHRLISEGSLRACEI